MGVFQRPANVSSLLLRQVGRFSLAFLLIHEVKENSPDQKKDHNGSHAEP